MNSPDPVEVKALLTTVLGESNHKGIASELKIHTSDISRRFSPTCPRKAGIAEGLRELHAIAKVDPAAFQVLKEYVTTLLDSWTAPVNSACVASLVCEADQESDDVIRSWAQGRPIHEQHREAAEAIAALQRFIACTQPERKGAQVSLPTRARARMRRAG